MKYSIIKGDLFNVSSDYALAHCISSDFCMGGGIAKQFTNRGTKKFLFSNYVNCWYGEGYVLPSPPVYSNHEGEYTGKVYNLVTKKNVYDKPTYQSLTEALENLREYNEPKIAMPLIGCGLDGLEWEKVEEIIKNVFENTETEILVVVWDR